MDPQRPLIEEAFFAGVSAAAPEATIPNCLVREGKRIYLRKKGKIADMTPLLGGRLCIIASGKAASRMFRTTTSITGTPNIGLVISPPGDVPIPGTPWIRGSHPYPDSDSLLAARKILQLLSDLKPEDSLIFLLSGGSSSMTCHPPESLTLEDKVATLRAVMEAGASIFQLNRVRRALSITKGGDLARSTRAGKICVLVMSDVPGNDLNTIGSGPFFASSSPDNPIEVIRELSLSRSIPRNALKLLIEKTDNASLLSHIPHVIISDNGTALAGSKSYLEGKGYNVILLDTPYDGPALSCGESFGRWIRSRVGTGRARATAYLGGGETVVKVTGEGRGGRNQVMAVGAGKALSRTSVTGLCAGTDGIDGDSPAAGGFFDGNLMSMASDASLDPDSFLENCDSYTFLHTLGYSFKTGPTGLNVMDISICLVL